MGLLGLNVNGGEEVCHNQFGPHNADFYNLLDEIRKVKASVTFKLSIP